ncbi:hybrid sensor histidine kinase/response regulator transcription factor [Marinifilum sp. RC60d5]|uniref:hybrid sensor histidine kinase/response regulator transcription factor n=1 Tax=Marinifilum sp. RC60d5 TaxID=3458414 RepID=UPI0040370119
MRALFFVFLFFVSVVSKAQTDFEHLTTLNGLSQNDINFIFQDSKGFMWFGTVDGLNRYDGMSFVQYRSTSLMEYPIDSNLPFCMVEDSKGNFWIGTSDNGVWFFDRKKEEFHKIPEVVDGKRIILDTKIVNVLIDSKEQLWIATPNGLCVFDINAYRKGKYDSTVFSTDEVVSKRSVIAGMRTANLIKEDSKGRVWIGNGSGLFFVELTAEKKLKQYRLKELSYGPFKDIIKTKTGYLTSGGQGVFYFNDFDKPEEIKVKRLVTYSFSSFLKSSKNYVFGGNSQGLFQFDWNEKKMKLKLINHFTSEYHNPNSLTKNNITDIFEDRSGLLWVGTNGGGLNQLDLNEKKFYRVGRSNNKGSIAYNKVRAVYEDKAGNLWIGTEGGGISFLSVKNKKDFKSGFLNINVDNKNLGQNYVYCYDSIPGEVHNKVLMGVGYPNRVGIATLKGENDISVEYYPDLVQNPVFASAVDRAGNIWLGTYGAGLYRVAYDHKTNKLIVKNHYTAEGKGSIASNVVRSVLEDASGNIFVGTDHGLCMLPFNEKSASNPFFLKATRTVGDPTSLAHNYVLDMYLDSKQRVWVGTMGGGLCLLQEYYGNDFKFKRYSSKQGLPNDVIKGIEEDASGNLWISTNKGLTSFNTDSEEIRNYNVSDGLQDYEFSECASYTKENGEMIFGGVNGFNIFNPREIEDNPYGSQVEFNELFVLNEKILTGKEYKRNVILSNEMPSTDTISLKYSQNSFTVGFTALHFVAPDKINYKYLLEGFDTEWNMVNSVEPRANYTNIPPGDYKLKVLATNNDGVWTTQPSVLHIEIVPPFWRTIYAFFIYIVVFVVLLVFFRRYSVIAVTKKNELMMEHFEQEKIEELVQMKLQFFTNISHEFRTPLTLIQSPLEKLISKKDRVDEEYRQKNYSLMIKNVRMLNRLITQLMEFRKLERGKMPLAVTRGNVIDLVKQVFDAFNEIAQSKNIRFELINTYPSIELWFDFDKIEKVLFNLLSNAFKFTPQGGQVAIVVGEEEVDGKEWVKIEVKDNGPGISKDKLPYLFDRFYQTGSHKLSKVSGTGIGLAFAKNLVNLHHGKISVESNPSIATVFSIHLPKGKLHFKKEDFSTQVHESSVNTQTIVKDYQHEKPMSDINRELKFNNDKPLVLIVEDNYDVQSLIKSNLEDKFNCIQGFNGKEGLELCKKYNPDVIISDVMMPVMDGFEMCNMIKNDQAICHIPIVVLTAKTTNEDKLTGLTEGAMAYLSKPFNIDVLIAQINTILEARKTVKREFNRKVEVEPKEITFTSIDEKLLERLLKVVEENISNPEFTVVQLGREVGISQSILNKKLKALLGQTANVFIRTIRLKRAAQLFKLDRLSVTDVVYEVGFNDMKYFRECFRKQFDTTPSEYIRQHREQQSQENKD